MLGTHSKLRNGQMSHICDISPLRVKSTLILSYNVKIQEILFKHTASLYFPSVIIYS